MTASDARSVLLLLNGDVRHSKAADLTTGEVTALALRSWGFPDRFIAARLRTTEGGARAVLENGRTKLVAWHRQQAKDVLAVVDNRRVPERQTYEDPRTGEEVEIRPMQSAEDAKLRMHPDVKPTMRQLTARVERALSAIVEG